MARGTFSPPGRIGRAIAITFNCLFLLLVPYRHGHWCCLCHPGRIESASGTSHERRNDFFLHEPLALHPQLNDTPPPSDTCDDFFSSWACSLPHCSHIVVYPQQSKRLICDPVKGLFVPLLVRARTTYREMQTQSCAPGVVICDHHNWNHQLRSYSGPRFRGGGIRSLLVNDLAVSHAYMCSMCSL
jgi:hypothetical protein